MTYMRYTPAANPRDFNFYRRTGTAAPERWYTIPTVGFVSLSGTMGRDILKVIPFIAPRNPTVLDRIAIKLDVGLGAEDFARLGVYADDGNLYPGSLLLDAGTVSLDDLGVKAISIDLTVTGLVWLAYVANASAEIGVIPRDEIATHVLGWPSTLLSSGLDNLIARSGYGIAFTFAPLPAPFPSGAYLLTGSGTTDNIPPIFVRMRA